MPESTPEQPQMTRRGLLRLGLALGAAGVLAGCGEKTVSRPPATTPENPLPTSMPETASPILPTKESKKPTGEFRTEPAWSQDFASMPNGAVNPQVWKHELNPEVPGWNNEAQGYTDNKRNVRVENGTLVIEAHREAYRYPGSEQAFAFTSGRIDTRESLSFEYGKLEATMKLPKGKGAWPAFWLLSANQPFTTKLHPTEADWEKEGFYLHDGELDIMEAYGDKPDSIEGTVHTFRKPNTSRSVTVTDATEVFHTYGIEVTPSKLTWTLDGKPYHTFEKPSDNPDDWPFGNGNKLYAILNLALSDDLAGKINPAQKAWRMEVKDLKFYDYVKK